MDNAVLNIKKGQNITLVIEGYEEHAASFDYDDVLQVILQQAQTDLNRRRSQRYQEKCEAEAKLQQGITYPLSNNSAAGFAVEASGLGLYPRVR